VKHPAALQLGKLTEARCSKGYPCIDLDDRTGPLEKHVPFSTLLAGDLAPSSLVPQRGKVCSHGTHTKCISFTVPLGSGQGLGEPGKDHP